MSSPLPGAGTAERIVVFGDVIDDVVVVPDGPVRRDTDTPSSIRHRAGGSAANVASWLGERGAAVDFVGRVGADDLARHRAILAGYGVTPHLVGDPEHPTGTIVILVEGESRSMLTERGANRFLSADDVDDELLEAAAVVHFTGYAVLGAEDHTAIGRLFERAAARGTAVSVDPASAGDLADFGVDRFLDIVGGAGLLFPNLDEGRVLTGLEQSEEIAAALGERFPLVALTVGGGGAIVAERGREPVAVPAERRSVVDPTGAGDAFTAGFLAAWVRDRDAVSAAWAGVATAGRAVMTVGGRPVSDPSER